MNEESLKVTQGIKVDDTDSKTTLLNIQSGSERENRTSDVGRNPKIIHKVRIIQVLL